MVIENVHDSVDEMSSTYEHSLGLRIEDHIGAHVYNELTHTTANINHRTIH